VLPPELIVILLSASPILELRGAIPVGKFLGMPLEAVFIWSIVGNMLPIFIIMKYLDPVTRFLIRKSKWFEKFFTRIFETTRKKHSKRFEEVGAIFLVTFIAIPLPGTGAWTGALISHLFNIPYWKSILLIFLGVVGAAVIVSLTVESVNQVPGIIKFLFN
jgi:uncharacterized membrane protein